MKVLWLTNIPSPYRVDFFNELGKYCELTVLFEKRSSDERDESWKSFKIYNFKAVFLRGISVGVAEAFCPSIIKYLNRNRYDKFFVTNYSDLTGILAIAIMRLRHISYIIEGDGAFAGSGQGIKEKVKHWIISNSELCFSTSKIHDEYYRTYGASEEKIVRYPFTSLYISDILIQPISVKKKKKLREDLGMKEKYIVLAVGQFIPRKGYDILIKSFSYLNDNIGCYIVGGKAPKEYKDLILALGLSNIHFIDFKKKLELEKYYMAADLFTHPCREDIWGLVINEAMAKGLPVITTERCVAGLELISDLNIGRIVPTENSKLLANAINDILYTICKEKSKAVLEVIRPYTLEKMAQKHIEILERG